MNKFLTFLGEAWPPSQKKTGPPAGKQKSPFGNSAGPKKPKPSFGEQGTPSKPGSAKKPPFGSKSSPKDDGSNPPSGQPGQDEDAGPNGAFGQQGPVDKESILAMQEIEQQKAEEEAALARQKMEQEAAERQKIKNLRAAADNEVMDALGDKFNDDTDYVEFYPDMLSFTQYNDAEKEKDIKQRGKTPLNGPSGPNGPSGNDQTVVDRGANVASSPKVQNSGQGDALPLTPKEKKSKKDPNKKKKVQDDEDDDDFDESESSEQSSGYDDTAVEPTKDREGEKFYSLDKEKQAAQGDNTGQAKPRVFKIKPVDHVSGSKFVGQDEFEDEIGDEEDGEENGDEDSEEASAFGKSKGAPEDEDIENDDEGDEEAAGTDPKKKGKRKSKDPDIKRFGDSSWKK